MVIVSTLSGSRMLIVETWLMRSSFRTAIMSAVVSRVGVGVVSIGDHNSQEPSTVAPAVAASSVG